MGVLALEIQVAVAVVLAVLVATLLILGLAELVEQVAQFLFQAHQYLMLAVVVVAQKQLLAQPLVVVEMVEKEIKTVVMLQ
jgi:hypothetical protein